MEHLPHSDPPTPEELTACRQWVDTFLRNEVQPPLEPTLQQAERKAPALRGAKRRLWHGGNYGNSSFLLVGAGGTATLLARIDGQMEDFDRVRIEAARLSRESVQRLVGDLWTLSLEQRKKTPGLPATHADIILTGSVIYQVVMEVFGFRELRVSTRGLRFAAVISDPSEDCDV